LEIAHPIDWILGMAENGCFYHTQYPIYCGGIRLPSIKIKLIYYCREHEFLKCRYVQRIVHKNFGVAIANFLKSFVTKENINLE